MPQSHKEHGIWNACMHGCMDGCGRQASQSHNPIDAPPVLYRSLLLLDSYVACYGHLNTNHTMQQPCFLCGSETKNRTCMHRFRFCLSTDYGIRSSNAPLQPSASAILPEKSRAFVLAFVVEFALAYLSALNGASLPKQMRRVSQSSTLSHGNLAKPQHKATTEKFRQAQTTPETHERPDGQNPKNKTKVRLCFQKLSGFLQIKRKLTLTDGPTHRPTNRRWSRIVVRVLKPTKTLIRCGREERKAQPK